MVMICLCAFFPGDYSFERDVLKETQCEVHTFDCTKSAKEPSEALVWGAGASAGPAGWKERLSFHPWCIHGGDTNAGGAVSAAAGGNSTRGGDGGPSEAQQLVFKTYHEITRELGHHRVDVLKVSARKDGLLGRGRAGRRMML